MEIVCKTKYLRYYLCITCFTRSITRVKEYNTILRNSKLEMEKSFICVGSHNQKCNTLEGKNMFLNGILFSFHYHNSILCKDIQNSECFSFLKQFDLSSLQDIPEVVKMCKRIIYEKHKSPSPVDVNNIKSRCCQLESRPSSNKHYFYDLSLKVIPATQLKNKVVSKLNGPHTILKGQRTGKYRNFPHLTIKQNWAQNDLVFKQKDFKNG